MRLSLLETPYMRARDVTSHLKDALKFLIQNPQCILQSDKVREIETQRLFSSTATARIYHTIAASGKMNNFLFLDYSDISSRGASIPDILTSDDLCIDGSKIDNIIVPALVKRCWINVTPILASKRTRDAYNDTLNFTDLGQLANLVTRAALCQAYQDSDNWITIRQQLLLLELYAVIMAQVMTNTYRLDPIERRNIMTIFAAYYAQMIGTQEIKADIPPLLLRCPFLGSGTDIMQIMEELKKFREKDGFLTLDGVIKAICKIGPSRMKNYNIHVLFRSIAGAAVDSSTMIVSMYYPPYFLYQLLRVASGYKNPVLSGIIKVLGLKKKLDMLCDDVADNPNLIGVLNR